MTETKSTIVIPCRYERSFDFIFNQNKENLAALISLITDFDYNYVFKNIRKISNNSDIRHKKDKKRQMDFVYELGDTLIDVEINNKAKESLERNIRYIFSIHLRKSVRGSKDNEIYQTIQININKNNVVDSKNIIDEYLFRTKDKIVLTENVKIIIINLSNLKKLWYTGSEQQIKEYELLMSFIMKDTEPFKKILKNERMKSIMKKMEEFNEDNKNWVTFRDENEYEDLLNIMKKNARESGFKSGQKQGIKQGVKEGRKEGIKQGLEQGQIKRNFEIATNLLRNKIDINIISDVTTLNISEIKKLQENMF